MPKPWIKFYPTDWRSDPRLRMCSLASRGLWMDLISYMHEGEPYGYLTLDGVSPDLHEIASLVARPIGEVRRAFTELESRRVFSRDENGAIYSRRMVRDYAKALADAENGKQGGNPRLKVGVNPSVNGEDKAQIPDAKPRIQNQKSEGVNCLGEVNGPDRSGPRHGAHSKARGTVYFRQGTPEWDAYAEDYKSAHQGQEPVADRHGGHWFRWIGEHTIKKRA